MSSSAADHQAAERVHQRVVAIAAVAGAEQVLDQPFEPLVAQPAVQVGEELLLLARADVVQTSLCVLVCSSSGKYFSWLAGLESSKTIMRHRMAVPPEVLVVCFDRLAHVAQAVRRDHERHLGLVHGRLLVV